MKYLWVVVSDGLYQTTNNRSPIIYLVLDQLSCYDVTVFDSPHCCSLSQKLDEQLGDGGVPVISVACGGLNGLQELKVEDGEEAVRSLTGEKL